MQGPIQLLKSRHKFGSVLPGSQGKRRNMSSYKFPIVHKEKANQFPGRGKAFPGTMF